MVKLDYPVITYYIGTAREVKSLFNTFVRKGIGIPDIHYSIPAGMDYRCGSLYAFAIKKSDAEIPTIWKKGECFIVDVIDTQYLLMGEIERQREIA